MSNAWETLENAFIEDHKQLSRGFRKIIDAIRSDDYQSARVVAEELDQTAGPHIQFEERYLYPEVRQSRGESYTARLYAEHADAVKTLLEMQVLDSPPSAETKQQWVDGIQRGLDHAASCGTLLSHLQTLDPERQAVLLTRLDELRQEGKKWSELHPVHDNA